MDGWPMILGGTIAAVLVGVYHLLKTIYKVHEPVKESLAESVRIVMEQQREQLEQQVVNDPERLSLLCPANEFVSPHWRIVYHELDDGTHQWQAWNHRLEVMPEDEYGRSYSWLFVTDTHPIPTDKYEGLDALLHQWQRDHAIGPYLADCLEDHWPDAPPTLLYDLRRTG